MSKFQIQVGLFALSLLACRTPQSRILGMHVCLINDQNKSHLRALLFVLFVLLKAFVGILTCGQRKLALNLSLLGHAIFKLVLHLLRQGGSLSQSTYFGFTFSNLSEFIPYSGMGD